MPLTTDDLEQVREYIFRQLPWVLEKDPDFAMLVEGIVASKFPRRDEFARLLDELTASRQEQREGFVRLDGRVDTLEHRVDGLQAGQEELRADVKELRVGQEELQAGQEELRTDVKELRAGQEELRADVKGLQAGQEELRADVKGLQAGQEELRADVRELRTGQDKLWAGQEELRTGQDKLWTGQDKLWAGQEELRTGQDKLWAGQEELRLLIDQRTSELRQAISDAFAQLGQRWGMMTEDVLRQVVKAIVQKTYGGEVREVTIGGEQYDCVVSDGEHILLEITARATQKIIGRLQRKRAVYIEHTGIEPARVLLATAQIHYTVARRLQEMGVEVIQPDILIEDEATDEIVSASKH